MSSPNNAISRIVREISLSKLNALNTPRIIFDCCRIDLLLYSTTTARPAAPFLTPRNSWTRFFFDWVKVCHNAVDVEMVTTAPEKNVRKRRSRKRIDNNSVGEEGGEGMCFESATGDKTIITFLMIITMLFYASKFLWQMSGGGRALIIMLIAWPNCWKLSLREWQGRCCAAINKLSHCPAQ